MRQPGFERETRSFLVRRAEVRGMMAVGTYGEQAAAALRVEGDMRLAGIGVSHALPEAVSSRGDSQGVGGCQRQGWRHAGYDRRQPGYDRRHAGCWLRAVALHHLDAERAAGGDLDHRLVHDLGPARSDGFGRHRALGHTLG